MLFPLLSSSISSRRPLEGCRQRVGLFRCYSVHHWRRGVSHGNRDDHLQYQLQYQSDPDSRHWIGIPCHIWNLGNVRAEPGSPLSALSPPRFCCWQGTGSYCSFRCGVCKCDHAGNMTWPLTLFGDCDNVLLQYQSCVANNAVSIPSTSAHTVLPHSVLSSFRTRVERSESVVLGR